MTRPLPPLRPELQEAIHEMNAKPGYFAWAICRTWDDTGWEVKLRTGYNSFPLEGEYTNKEDAISAGEAWLQEQLARELTESEMILKPLWEETSLAKAKRV